jgi:hypothetical protein
MKSEFDLGPDKADERLDTTKIMIEHAKKASKAVRLTFNYYYPDMGCCPLLSDVAIVLKDASPYLLFFYTFGFYS